MSPVCDKAFLWKILGHEILADFRKTFILAQNCVDLSISANTNMFGQFLNENVKLPADKISRMFAINLKLCTLKFYAHHLTKQERKERN